MHPAFLLPQIMLALGIYCGYTNCMPIEFDPNKDQTNQAKHGVSLALAESFDMEAAQITPDTRFAYTEERMIALGPIGDRIYVLIYTMRGDVMRVISLRKANRREVLSYVEKT